MVAARSDSEQPRWHLEPWKVPLLVSLRFTDLYAAPFLYYRLSSARLGADRHCTSIAQLVTCSSLA